MFRIVTYNVLAQSYVKPRRYPNCSPADLDADTRRARLLDHIESLDADILALQEAEPDLIEALRERLTGLPHLHAAQHQDAPDGCAIFSKTPFTNRANPFHHLPDTRTRATVLASTEIDSRRVGVASVHLSWQPNETPTLEHLGRAQLLETLDHIERADPEATWIICGDFNANSQSCVIRAAEERGWVLSCRSQRPWDSTNINNRRRKIDYLLIRHGSLIPTPGKLPKLGRYEPMPSATHPSDHLAVSVDFEFPT